MKIHTSKGSVYDVDLDAKTVQRVSSVEGMPLRKDGEVRPLHRIAYPPVVGLPFIFVLDVRGDGIETVRTTSPVTQIEE